MRKQKKDIEWMPHWDVVVVISVPAENRTEAKDRVIRNLHNLKTETARVTDVRRAGRIVREQALELISKVW